jgi:hypothetical protein
MTEIEQLAELLHASSPHLDLRLDFSEALESAAWLDVERQGRIVAVEWRPRQGFGISLLGASGDPRAGLFEGPDEILSDVRSARDRILFLLAADAPFERSVRAARRG